MDNDTYNAWRAALEDWLQAHPAGDDPDLAPSGAPVPDAARQVLAQARRVAEAINATLPGFEGGSRVNDRNHYDFMSQRLGELMASGEMSLAEYVYELAGGQRPGVRLWYESGQPGAHSPLAGPRVTVMVFPEVGMWSVDQSGRKIHHDLAVLALTPHIHYLNGKGGGWRDALAEALARPVAGTY